jgi:16S rRNA (cytidine1402-2'-O)-methyltransferase
VVSTPIGNLRDTTARAVDTLRAVEVVAAEDTRRSRILLSHFGIAGPVLRKLDANSSDGAIERLVATLVAGRSVALLTDAGTPSVSDPGARLVRGATEASVPVVVVPGASAVTAAVAVSGLVDGPFFFMGFLPRKGEKRRRALERIAATTEPIVLFEAPTRLHATIADLAKAVPERPACVCRELTKVHEGVYRGTPSQLLAAEIPARGEVTLVLGPQAPKEPPALSPQALDEAIEERLARGDGARTVAQDLARALGQPRRLVYARAVALKERRERPPGASGGETARKERQ